MSNNDCVQEAFKYLNQKYKRGKQFHKPADVGHYFITRLASESSEVFCVAFLDIKHRVLSCENLFQGTIDGCSVHIRVIIQKALELNAASIILAHNHPSGDPSPSTTDKHVTKRVKEACTFVDIRVIDHIIVGGAMYHSAAEAGWI